MRHPGPGNDGHATNGIDDGLPGYGLPRPRRRTPLAVIMHFVNARFAFMKCMITAFVLVGAFTNCMITDKGMAMRRRSWSPSTRFAA